MSATKGNPHAASMLEYAKDWAETRTPWERWQYQGQNDGSLWQSLYGHPNWLDDFQYRPLPTPPATILINGIKVPEPVREPLNIGDRYFVPDLCGSFKSQWDNDATDRQRLRAGIIHIHGSSADIHRKALLSFTAKEEAQ